MYDYTIIGAGPAGLTLAWYLAKYNNKVLLIDREMSIGGCHRVRRINGLFTEHGPRIYINNYFSLIDILKDMNLDFYDLFTKYSFSVNNSVSDIMSILSYKETFAIVYEFLKFMINESQSKQVTMEEFTSNYNFKTESVIHLDNLCRQADGGTIKNFTLFEFFQIFNQNILYTLYQPKLPNDVGLLKHWKKALDNTGNIDFMFGTEVLSINSTDNVNYVITNDNKNIKSKKYVFAIPPQPMLNIIKNSTNKNMFGNITALDKWEQESRYFVYIPIIFHWDSKVDLRKVRGLTKSEYSLVYIIVSDYMDFNDARSKTVITCSVKITDKKSKHINKTADECNENELITEVFRQLKEHQPYLPNPTTSILSPGVYKNKQTNKWETNDTAFFYTKAGYQSNKSIYDNLYWVGTHNGNSNYSFTALESAMENAIALLHELEPSSKETVLLHSPSTFKSVVVVILIILILVIIKIIS